MENPNDMKTKSGYFVQRETTTNRSEGTIFQIKFHQLLSQNMDNPRFTIEDACHQLLMSRSKLYRKIKRHYGKTFTELLIHLRINRAKELLLHSPNTVSEIAYTTGFSDPSYFAKCFKKHVQTTPAIYRARC